jgi:hypothetical protein
VKITKHTVDRAVAIGAAVAAPILTTLVDTHVLAAVTATDIGAVVTAAVAAYHGGAAVQRKRSEPQLGELS